MQWHIHRYDELTSTQDLAHEMAGAGAPAGSVVVAKLQTAGRGRSGNSWQSITGNLLCSIILRPDIEPMQAGQYSFMSAIALNRALAEILSEDHTVKNKWPNDLLVDDKKIAGILLEAVIEDGNLDALIIGLGLNIVAAPDDRSSVHGAGAWEETSDTMLNAFLANLAEVIAEYESEGFAGLRDEWLSEAAGLHKAIRVRLPKAQFEGVFEGLEADGALRLRLANGEIKVVHSGEVFFG